MSDMGFSGVDGVVHNPTPSGEMTAGAMMRTAREAAGLHVAALAVSMKIPVKKLEALEADRLDLLHDAVFVRALAASVCRALKIDATPVLNKLPLNAAPNLNPDEGGINAPFRTPGDTGGILNPTLFSKPSAILAVALVVAGVAVFFFPDIKLPDWSGELGAQATKSADGGTQSSKDIVEAFPPSVSATTTVPNLSNTTASEVAPAVPANPVTASTMAPTPLPPMAQASSAAVTPAVVASQALAAASKPAVPASRPTIVASAPAASASRTASAPVLPSTGLVVFKARGATWVKVVDAKGVVQLSKTLAEGEVVGASGATPLSVVIGRVDATDVEVRGQAFSLAAVSKENVARFEVK